MCGGSDALPAGGWTVEHVHVVDNVADDVTNELNLVLINLNDQEHSQICVLS